MLLQKNQTAVFLDEVVIVFAQQIANNDLCMLSRNQRNNTAKPNGYCVAKSDTKAHCLLIGLQ
jgi:hypothetical protein